MEKRLANVWRTAGWVLQDAAVVDARHLVLVFHVDHSLSLLGGSIPGQLTKYSDTEDHAPYRAACLKLATLRHYRNGFFWGLVEGHQATGGVATGRVQPRSDTFGPRGTSSDHCRRGRRCGGGPHRQMGDREARDRN